MNPAPKIAAIQTSVAGASSPGKQTKADPSQEALIRFTDFIYAGVFALAVRETFDNIINKQTHFSFTDGARLGLLVVVFYFLAWDWILGRLLIIRYPYESYTAFFCEVLIGAFGYGTVSAILKGSFRFVPHLAFVLLFGAAWAARIEHKANEKDKQEMCMIQVLQFTGGAVIALFAVWWYYMRGPGIDWMLSIVFSVILLAFITVYELLVPRPKSVKGGPGVPFVSRSRLRRIRRQLEEAHLRLWTTYSEKVDREDILTLESPQERKPDEPEHDRR